MSVAGKAQKGTGGKQQFFRGVGVDNFENPRIDGLKRIAADAEKVDEEVAGAGGLANDR
jgi:hypothetical protein